MPFPLLPSDLFHHLRPSDGRVGVGANLPHELPNVKVWISCQTICRTCNSHNNLSTGGTVLDCLRQACQGAFHLLHAHFLVEVVQEPPVLKLSILLPCCN